MILVMNFEDHNGLTLFFFLKNNFLILYLNIKLIKDQHSLFFLKTNL